MRRIRWLLVLSLGACEGKTRTILHDDEDPKGTGGAASARGGSSTAGGNSGSRGGRSGAGGTGKGGTATGGTGGSGGDAGGEPGTGGVAGESGAGGEGGEGAVRFVLLEPPPPRSFPVGVPATSRHFDFIEVHGASADGSVLAGTIHYQFQDAADLPDQNEAFVWTEADGVVRLGNVDALPGRPPHRIQQLWTNADGTRLFGSYDRQLENGDGSEPGGVFAWTLTDGFYVPFDFSTVDPLNIAELSISFVSEDARAAAGTYRTRADVASDRPSRTFHWTEAEDVYELGSAQGLPLPLSLDAMSSDGHTLLVSQDDSDPRLVFLYHQGARARSLEALAGSPSCSGDFLSADGASVVGTCSPGVGAFRWSEANGLQPLEGFESADHFVQDVSTDGSVLFGVRPATGGRHGLFRWTSRSGMEDIPTPPEISTTTLVLFDDALSRDGRSAFGVSLPTDTFHDIGDPGTQAFRWSDAAGIEPLGFLPGDTVSQVFGASRDGSLHVGESRVPRQPGHALLWDARGLRSLQAIVDGADIDRHGFDLWFASRVWASGSTVIVQGTATNATGDQRPFVAWLPLRE